MFSGLTNAKIPWLKKVGRYRAWILVALVVLFAVAIRVRLRDMPLERDEGEYAYAGQLMLQGIPPYQLAYNMKLPGTYAAYALLMALFGQSPSGVHLGLSLVNAATIVLIFLLGRKLLDEITGITAATSFALMSLSSSMLGLQAHATHFVILPAVGGALVLLAATESGRLRTIFASGLLFGVAFVMKQHGAFFGAFGFFYLAWTRSRTQTEQHAWSRIRARSVRFDWFKFGKELASYIAGLSLPYFFTAAVLLAAGVLPRFVFWTITYAGKYISAVPLSNGSAMFRNSLSIVTSPNIFFWLLAAFGAILLWNERRLRRHKFFLPGLFVASCISISLGLYFRAHYFILLLPALSLLAGVAVGRAWHLLKSSQSVERFAAVPAIGLFVIGLGSSLILHGEIWFGLSPVKACRQIYGNNLFPEAVEIGSYLRTNTLPKETVAVLGSEPEIYFYSRRHSATGYIYMYPLRETHSYALKMQREMIQEIEAARPEYIVFVTANESWLPQPGSKSILQDWWPGYSKTNYDLVRITDIEAEKLEGNLDAEKLEKKKETPPSPGQLLVLKRKPAAQPLPAVGQGGGQVGSSPQ